MAGRKHYRPFLKVALSTLIESGRIVVKNWRGTLKPEDVDEITQRWQQRIVEVGEAEVFCFGREHVENAARGPADIKAGKRSYVVMTNHQSLVDVPSVIRTYPGRVRMVGKRELGQVPVWGSAMRASGVVFVDRGNREQSIKALERAKEQLAEGTSIWIAPEGTRSKDGQLGPLKKGGFHLARQLGAPIAPAWITGTKEIIDPSSFGVTLHGTVTVRYGRPIETSDVDEKGIEQLMAQVRDSLLALQKESEAWLASRKK